MHELWDCCGAVTCPVCTDAALQQAPQAQLLSTHIPRLCQHSGGCLRTGFLPQDRGFSLREHTCGKGEHHPGQHSLQGAVKENNKGSVNKERATSE